MLLDVLVRQLEDDSCIVHDVGETVRTRVSVFRPAWIVWMKGVARRVRLDGHASTYARLCASCRRGGVRRQLSRLSCAG